MEAIILAGGLGTRLQKVVSDKPKSMAMVNDRPFLEYLLNYLRGQEISKVVLSVGYLKESISKHFGDHYKNIGISYAAEDEPLGTGGGVRNAFNYIDGDKAFVLNGDSMFRIDLSFLKNFHQNNNADVTLALRSMEETDRYGTVIIDNEKRVTAFREKGSDSGAGMISGGVYMINKNYLDTFPEAFSLEKDCFEKKYSTDRIFGYLFKGYFLDIGMPEDYMRAQDEFKRFDD